MTTRTGWARPSGVLGPAVLGGAVYGPAVQALDVLAFGEAWSWGETAFRSGVFAAVLALVVGVPRWFSAGAREREGTAGAPPGEAAGEQGRAS